MEIRVPLLKERTGAGQLAKAALQTIGFRQRAGCRCEQIQKQLDRVQFVPRKEK